MKVLFRLLHFSWDSEFSSSTSRKTDQQKLGRYLPLSHEACERGMNMNLNEHEL